MDTPVTSPSKSENFSPKKFTPASRVEEKNDKTNEILDRIFNQNTEQAVLSPTEVKFGVSPDLKGPSQNPQNAQLFQGPQQTKGMQQHNLPTEPPVNRKLFESDKKSKFKGKYADNELLYGDANAIVMSYSSKLVTTDKPGAWEPSNNIILTKAPFAHDPIKKRKF